MSWDEVTIGQSLMDTQDDKIPATTAAPLKAPFPWFGGKSQAAALIWQAIGNCSNYVEPFAGSLAVLLNRPHPPQIETVNDIDGFVSNVWRALQAAPDEVAAHCDCPPNEADQHAVHTWLVNQRETFTARLMGDPDYYDAQVAGRWLYGVCCWIGSGWCSGNGAWQSIDGQLRRLGTAGQGVRRKRLHLGNAGQDHPLVAWFIALQQRLRYVRVCCGDWTRVLGPSVTFKHGLTGILLDPPYSADEDREPGLYACDDLRIAHAVRDWCLAHGAHPLLRIVLCGYGATHDALLLHGWRKAEWTANGGMSNQKKHSSNPNKYRETLWLSPACLPLDSHAQLDLLQPATWQVPQQLSLTGKD